MNPLSPEEGYRLIHCEASEVESVIETAGQLRDRSKGQGRDLLEKSISPHYESMPGPLLLLHLPEGSDRPG